MALTRQQFLAQYSALRGNDAIIDAALSYALDRVQRAHGLEYDSARPTQIAHWHSLEFISWPLDLCLLHPIASVESLVMNGQTLSPLDYTVDRNVGQLMVRHYFVWDTRAELRYVPQDKNALRDAIQAEIAVAYLTRSYQMLPTSRGADAPFFLDMSVVEARALRRLSPQFWGGNYPQYSEYAEVPDDG